MVCVLFIVLWLFPGIGCPIATADEAGTKPLTIAYCRYMPFYFEGLNKQPRGILVDIWEQWSAKTGIPVRFELLPWEETMEKTASGRIDIIALMYHTKERENRYRFSNPLMNLSTFLYVRRTGKQGGPIRKITRFEEIKHLSTGVVAKDFTRIFLNDRLPGLNPIVFQDHESLIKAAINNDIQAFLMEEPVASTYIAKHNGSDKIYQLENPVYTKPLFAGVAHQNPDLIKEINQGLSLIRPEEIRKIVQNWTGDVESLLFQPHAGSIKIAASIDNMPFHFADEQGNAVGYFIDLWKLWSKKTGIDVAFITAPWAESLDMVKSGRADIHAGCFFSIQRDGFLDYAGVLSNCETHFFFHESIFGLKNLEDLKGFNIGILDQDYAVEFVNRELPDAAIKKYGSHRALFDGVAAGEVRVFICDTPTALYFLEKLNLLSAFRYHPATPLYRKPFYSAVKEGNAALVSQINKGLEAITPKERAAIERKWMGAAGARENDRLVVAAAQSFPPFSMLNAEGRPSGLLIDMWEKWSLKTGKPIAFRLYERQSAVNALKDGIVDILSFMPPRETIQGWTQTSSAFYRLNWYLYYHENSLISQDAPSIGGILGALAGSRAYEWLKKNRPGNRVTEFETTRQMILAAAAGTIDGFVALPQEMAVLPDRLGLPGAFVQSSYPLFQQQMGGVVRNFNPDLIQLIDDGFKAITHTERIQIESRWVRDRQARVFNPGNDQILFTGDEQKWLVKHYDLNPFIRLGVAPEWPPFEFIGANLSYKGMVSDYVNLLNERLGLNMTMAEQIPRTTGRSEQLFSKIDVIPSALSFEPDSQGMIRTQPYLEFPWVIINRQQAPLIGGIRDLHGKTVAVIGRYAVKDRMRQEHPEIRILEVKTTQQGLAAVLSDQADGYVENLAVAGYQIQAQNHPGLKVAAATNFPGTGLVFCIRPDWPELAGILNKGIASISDQEHDQIRQKWFSVRFEHQVDAVYMREMFFKIGAAALILAGVFSFWNWQIRKRKEAAEAANLSKTKFLASLSHEIRTPLNAILGMTEMTLRSSISVQQKQNLTAVKDSALHLLDVITDILDFSTIEAGKMRIQNQTFYLNELLGSIEHTWKFLAQEKGLRFNLVTDEHLPLVVRTDPVRLQQVLGNLISNAVKFTHKGGVKFTIKQGFFRHKHKDDPNFVSLVFKIEDTGIGIQKDQLDDIFERFTQAETSVTRNYGGTGLGLSIGREAAKLMGGTLSVKSKPGKGSRFYLKLPLKLAAQKDAARINRPAGTPPVADPFLDKEDKEDEVKKNGLTFLLADDDPMNAGVFNAFMAGTGHGVIHADDGEKAIAALKKHSVDIVFMDIEMPRMDGISACEAIRKGAAGENNRNIPVIAMSAHVLEEFKQKSRAAGMDEFIAKPVDIEHLFSIIERFRPEQFKPAVLLKSLADILDLEKALASLGGNEALFLRILEIFVQETPEQLTTLSRCADEANISDIARCAHTLKGSAGRIFATTHSNLANNLETLCRTNDMDAIKSDAGILIHAFNDLIAKLC